MKELFYVGCGGAAGAVLRYLLSTIPIKSDFPFMTFFINVTGAVLIGAVIAYASSSTFSPEAVLFLKTGVCGGYTTFSTFSAETLQLLEQQKYGMGISYAVLSVICCVAGVMLGMKFMQK